MANRLFRVFNSKNHGAWYIAKDEDDALTLAKEDRHIRILENGVAQDQTEYYLKEPNTNLETLLGEGKRGRAWSTVPLQRGADDLRSLLESGYLPDRGVVEQRHVWACADIDNKLPFTAGE